EITRHFDHTTEVPLIQQSLVDRPHSLEPDDVHVGHSGSGPAGRGIAAPVGHARHWSDRRIHEDESLVILRHLSLKTADQRNILAVVGQNIRFLRSPLSWSDGSRRARQQRRRDRTTHMSNSHHYLLSTTPKG